MGRRRRKQRAGEVQTGDGGGGAWTERARKMYCMSVTLDVSQLSGWLNALAFCRVEVEACEGDDMRAGKLVVVVGGGAAAAAQAACRRGPDWRGGHGRAERTWNMYCMLVTLDVFRLSGWLNAYASCRVQGEAWKEGDMRAGRWEGGVGRQPRKQRAGGGPDWRRGQGVG